METKVNTPFGGASYEGDSPFKDMIGFAAAAFLIIGAGFGIYHIFRKKEKRFTTNENIRKDNATTQNKIKLDNARTENEIKKQTAKSQIKINERESLFKLQTDYQSNKQKKEMISEPQISSRTWIKEFHRQYKAPHYSGIPVLGPILEGCPKGYKDAMMFHLLPAFGSMCFSKVRAKYIDGTMQSPSLLTVIEGVSGSGKGNFNTMYKRLFRRIIDTDCEKLSNDGKGQIIQTIGIHVSASKFMDILAGNKGVHAYIMEPEIDTVKNAFCKTGGLTFSTIRKAFDNDIEYQNNKSKNSVKGGFPVYLNATFTGTPKAIDSLINAREVESGSGRRFCFSAIPELGAKSPVFKWIDGEELESIQNQIDGWRYTYCYYHDSQGGDIPCDEFTINLDYVNEELSKWCQQQYERYKEDGIEERNNMRNGIACMAFHSAIVLHMLAGNPDEKEKNKRNEVKRCSVYIANYCMERYLTKFSSNGGIRSVSTSDATTTSSIAQTKRKMTQEEIEYWYPLRSTSDKDGKTIGLGYIAKQLGTTKDEVRNAFERYRKKNLN